MSQWLLLLVLQPLDAACPRLPDTRHMGTPRGVRQPAMLCLSCDGGRLREAHPSCVQTPITHICHASTRVCVVGRYKRQAPPSRCVAFTLIATARCGVGRRHCFDIYPPPCPRLLCLPEVPNPSELELMSLMGQGKVVLVMHL